MKLDIRSQALISDRDPKNPPILLQDVLVFRRIGEVSEANGYQKARLDESIRDKSKDMNMTKDDAI